MPGQVEAFAHFGVTLTNPRWSWSGLTTDGQVVATIWSDEMDYKSNPPSYSCFDHPKLAEWKDRIGNRERIRHFKHALDKWDGVFRVVMVRARDNTANVRAIEEASASDLIMKLTKLNEVTGEFHAVVGGKEKFRRLR